MPDKILDLPLTFSKDKLHLELDKAKKEFTIILPKHTGVEIFHTEENIDCSAPIGSVRKGLTMKIGDQENTKIRIIVESP